MAQRHDQNPARTNRTDEDAALVLTSVGLGVFAFLIFVFVFALFLRSVPFVVALTGVAGLGVFACVVAVGLSKRAHATPDGYRAAPPVLRLSAQARRRS